MFTALTERKDLLMALTDRLGHIEWVNSAFAERTGLPADSLVGQKFFAVLGYKSQFNVQQAYIREQLLKGESFKFELSYQIHDERECWLLVDGQPINDAEGITSQYAVMCSDITLRKLTEKDLEQTRQRLKRLLENVKLVPWEAVGVTRQFTYVGPQAGELFGYDLEQWYEPNFWHSHIHPEDLPLVINHHHSEELESGNYMVEYRFLTADGKWVWLKDTVNSVRLPDNNIQLIGFLIDITERKQTELSLQAALHNLEQINQQLEVRVQQRTIALTQEKEKLEETLQQLQKAQVLLIQSEKMSNLGQLVAGVAHEINNPVNFIYGNLTFAREYIEDLLRLLQCYQRHCQSQSPQLKAEIEAVEIDFIMEDLPRLLSSMSTGADRIREIVLSLRNFSRLDEAEFKKADIHAGIDSTLMILHSRLQGIKVIKEYCQLPLIECYPGQLNQVFMNIIANAIDALEELVETNQPLVSYSQATDNGQMTTRHCTIRIRTELTEDEQVLIHIADNGPGISQEVKERLFDTFFTTKAVGKGTGLGLSISYKIVVEKHQGQLECHSQPGKGTEFIISIPAKQSKNNPSTLEKV
jgi:PAS domain S-box-containing protein